MRYLPHTPTVPGVASAGLVSLIGVLLFVPNALWLVSGSGSTPGTVLAAVGTLLSTVLVLGRYLLLRDETTATHVPRVAGWAVLGTVLLGLIVVLIDLTGVGIPLFAGATLLSVSTFAHVIIDVRDVQRIRAEELAQQREKLAVLNRLVRHNLRHEAQYLLGAKSMLTSADAPDERETISADVGEVAEQLTEMHDTLERTQQIIRRGSRSNSEVDLGEAAARVVSEYRQAYPEATITVDVPGGSHGQRRAGTRERHRGVTRERRRIHRRLARNRGDRRSDERRRPADRDRQRSRNPRTGPISHHPRGRY
jgi:two-component system OmpR family sensor kinase